MPCFWYCTRGWIYGTKNVGDLLHHINSHCAQLHQSLFCPPSIIITSSNRDGHTQTQDTHTQHTHTHIKEETLQAFPFINTCSFLDCFSWSFPALHTSCYILFPGNPFPVKAHWTVTLADMCKTITSAVYSRGLEISLISVWSTRKTGLSLSWCWCVWHALMILWSKKTEKSETP